MGFTVGVWFFPSFTNFFHSFITLSSFLHASSFSFPLPSSQTLSLFPSPSFPLHNSLLSSFLCLLFSFLPFPISGFNFFVLPQHSFLVPFSLRSFLSPFLYPLFHDTLHCSHFQLPSCSRSYNHSNLSHTSFLHSFLLVFSFTFSLPPACVSFLP